MRPLSLVLQAMKDANLSKSDIDEDHSCRRFYANTQNTTESKEVFGKEPNKSVNPDEVVALGSCNPRWSVIW